MGNDGIVEQQVYLHILINNLGASGLPQISAGLVSNKFAHVMRRSGLTNIRGLRSNEILRGALAINTDNSSFSILKSHTERYLGRRRHDGTPRNSWMSQVLAIRASTFMAKPDLSELGRSCLVDLGEFLTEWWIVTLSNTRGTYSTPWINTKVGLASPIANT